MFKTNTVASILSAHTATINKLLAVQTAQTIVADKKAVEAEAANRAVAVARYEASRAGAIALKFQNLVDSESI